MLVAEKASINPKRIVLQRDALPPPSDPAAPLLMSELSEFFYDDMGRLTAATHPERFATALPLEKKKYNYAR